MSPTTKSAPKASARATASRPAAASPSPPSAEAAAVDMARELAAIVDAHGLAELQVETAGVSLTIRRGPGGAAAPALLHAAPHPTPSHTLAVHAPAPAPAPATAPAPAAPAVDEKFHLVTSPFVGTYYASPSPDAAPYVAEGQRVDKGQVLCIVEAMKLMNEIEADVAGTVVEILVENGRTVEYGQPLFKLSRA